MEARIEALVYQGSQTDVTARLADGQRVLVFVVEPALPAAGGGADGPSVPARRRVHGAHPRRGSGMTGAARIVAGLESAGVTLTASVPDTWIGRLMAEVRRSPRIRTVDVAREEEAVAVTCGANLAGGRGAVLIQNAGLLNCGGILGGLVALYRLPCFFIVSFRGTRATPSTTTSPRAR